MAARHPHRAKANATIQCASITASTTIEDVTGVMMKRRIEIVTGHVCGGVTTATYRTCPVLRCSQWKAFLTEWSGAELVARPG